MIFRQDKMALQRLKESAEKAKIELSSAMETEINLAVYHRRRFGTETFGYEIDPLKI